MTPHHLWVVLQHAGPLPIPVDVETGDDAVAEDGPDQSTVGDRCGGRVTVVLPLSDGQRVASRPRHLVDLLCKHILGSFDRLDLRHHGLLVLGRVEAVFERDTLLLEHRCLVGQLLQCSDLALDTGPVAGRGDIGVAAGALPQHLAVLEIELGQPEGFDAGEDGSASEHRQAVAASRQLSGPGYVLVRAPVRGCIGFGVTALPVVPPTKTSECP